MASDRERLPALIHMVASMQVCLAYRACHFGHSGNHHDYGAATGVSRHRNESNILTAFAMPQEDRNYLGVQ